MIAFRAVARIVTLGVLMVIAVPAYRALLSAAWSHTTSGLCLRDGDRTLARSTPERCIGATPSPSAGCVK